MKNFCEALKIFVIGLIFSSMMIFSANCSADDYYSRPITQLNEFVGNWYDTNGNLVLSISSDYKVNGCPVVYYGTGAGIFKIRIDEGNKYKDIEFVGGFGSWGFSDYHEMLVMNFGKNNECVLRRTKNQRYFKSVGGIYLGMNKNQVVSKYGQPSKKVSS